MSITRQLREQHREILEGANRLLSLVREDAGAHAEQIVLLLQDLSDKVLMHLDLEDEVFYPAALRDSNEAFAGLAAQYWTAMGAIRDLFTTFVDTWAKVDQIRAEPEGFLRETEVVLGYLERRIQREDRDLYPLVEP